MSKSKSVFMICPCCGSQVDKDSPELGRSISNFCELRTPLNSIIGFSHTLLDEEDGSLNNKQRENLDTILKGGEHLLCLINDIIDTAKIWSGSIEIQYQNLDLREVINGVVESAKPLIQGRPIQIKQELTDKALTVYADPLRVWQVLLNLLSNAAKFTIEGSITIRTQTIEEDNQQMAQITIQDTGIGIAAEDLDIIFDPFERKETPPTRAPSLDLGLAISKALVELQGGQLWAESEQGIGSRFHFTLPV
jgi:signal transduction histidine kinase